MNRIGQESEVLQIQEAQGWTDASMLDLMGSFIYGKAKRTEQFIKHLRRAQAEENADSDEPQPTEITLKVVLDIVPGEDVQDALATYFAESGVPEPVKVEPA